MIGSRVVSLVTLATMSSCGGSADANAKPASAATTTQAPADFVAAESTTVVAPLVLPSQLYVDRDVVISARTSGVLIALDVDLGASVTANQVIGRVDDEGATLTLARANVAYDAAQRTLWRAKELQKSKGITDSEVEDAEQRLKLADVTRREAEFALTMTKLVSPFDGVVTARYAQPGRLIAAQDTVLRIAARGPQLARVRVPESSALTLRVGGRVSVIATDGSRAAARIVRIAPAIDAASSTREVVVQLSGATRASTPLLNGSSVTVELRSGSRRALTVPKAAIASGGYVLVWQGTRGMVRTVVTGASDGTRTEIVAGLQSGERVRRVAP